MVNYQRTGRCHYCSKRRPLNDRNECKHCDITPRLSFFKKRWT